MKIPIHSIHYSIAYCPWRGTLITTTLLYEVHYLQLCHTIHRAFRNQRNNEGAYLYRRNCHPHTVRLKRKRNTSVQTDSAYLCKKNKRQAKVVKTAGPIQYIGHDENAFPFWLMRLLSRCFPAESKKLSSLMPKKAA